jgi:hypothetical protein
MPDAAVTAEAVYRNKGEFKAVNWWINQTSSKAHIDAVIAKVNELSPDIIALMALGENANIDADAVAKALGYPYYKFCTYSKTNGYGKGYLLMSRFPLTFKESKRGSKEAVTELFYLTTEVDGRGLDLYTGHDWNMLGTSYDKTVTYQNWILANAEASGNDFVVFGHPITNCAEYAGKAVELVNTGNIYLMTSKDGLAVDAKNVLTKPSTLTPGGTVNILTMDLKIPYTVSFNANGGTGTMADAKAIGSYTLPENGFTAPKGQKFKGWATSADGEVISSLNVTADIKLYAIWEPISLKVGYLSAYKFGGPKYSTYATQINNAIVNSGLDVLVINLLEKGGTTGLTGQWDNDDVAGKIATAVKAVYPYSYFASAGLLCDDQTGEYGNLILSKYEIDLANSKTISLANGTPHTKNPTTNAYGSFVEGRPAGQVRLDVAGYKVDVFYTHAGDANQSATLAAKINASQADTWIVMGHLPSMNEKLTGFKQVNSGNHRIMTDSVLAIGTLTTDTTSFTVGGYTVTKYSTTVTLPEA